MITMIKHPLILLGIVAVAFCAASKANATDYTIKCSGTLVGYETIAQGSYAVSFLNDTYVYEHDESDDDAQGYDTNGKWHEQFYGQSNNGDVATVDITMTQDGKVEVIKDDAKYSNCELLPTIR